MKSEICAVCILIHKMLNMSNSRYRAYLLAFEVKNGIFKTVTNDENNLFGIVHLKKAWKSDIIVNSVYYF